MDSDIKISSGSSGSSLGNCSVSSSSSGSGSGSDEKVSELIGKETSSGSSSFSSSSAGNSQDNASPSGVARSYTSRPRDTTTGSEVRILPPPPSMKPHGTSSASPLHDPSPSHPVDMTGAGEDKNSERLIYQDAVRNFNQPKTEIDLPPGTLSVPLMRHQVWMLQKETNCLHCSGGILADDQGLGKTVSMIALILKQKFESQSKSDISSKKEAEIVDLDADDESESESESHATQELKVSGNNKRPAAGTLVVCPASVVRQWERELDEKVSDESKLSVLVYHGGHRTKDPSVLAKYDVVITTYAIVTNEVPKQFLVDQNENNEKDTEKHGFSNSKKRKKRGGKSMDDSSFGTLSRVGWLRVVLDEAVG